MLDVWYDIVEVIFWLLVCDVIVVLDKSVYNCDEVFNYYGCYEYCCSEFVIFVKKV